MGAAVNPELYVSQTDLVRLRGLTRRFRALADRDTGYLDALEARLENAHPVLPQNVPANVVTMNTRVRLRDPESGKEFTYTVVYPEEADRVQNGLSVLAPLGAALLGAHELDSVSWTTPSGERHMVIEAILYQPEAVGHYDV